VEVQVLLDAHGNGVHLGDRDCSIQRRNQKVIEEAPSPGVDSRLRTKLGEHALLLAQAAGYQGVGTAEFLLDGKGNAYFLELNARLQVEHPVTELVTGRDLVADQLRVAAGEPLGFTQRDVSLRGHAIEARLYAEDPWAGFVPSTGAVLAARWPSGEGIRVDAGVTVGDVVGTRYDPLLGKIIAFALTRKVALDRLEAALAQTRVIGVTTNRGFLSSLMQVPELRAGRTTTDLLDRVWHPDDPPALDDAFQTAAAALARGRTGFQLNAPSRVRIAARDEIRSVQVDPARASAMPWAPDGEGVVLDVEGLAVRAAIAPPPTVDAALASSRHAGAASGDRVRAPMPGSVREIRATPGVRVAAGQVLLVLEAMKMEHAVAAPSAATVDRVLVSAGAQVMRGDVLVELA
jgi:acetyl/propionyl-CoA carboxylase alpha subunit